MLFGNITGNWDADIMKQEFSARCAYIKFNNCSGGGKFNFYNFYFWTLN